LYPARADIIQTNDFCLELAVVAIWRFLVEIQDETKVTHHYLESIIMASTAWPLSVERSNNEEWALRRATTSKQ
jgi:hypothetical protein